MLKRFPKIPKKSIHNSPTNTKRFKWLLTVSTDHNLNKKPLQIHKSQSYQIAIWLPLLSLLMLLNQGAKLKSATDQNVLHRNNYCKQNGSERAPVAIKLGACGSVCVCVSQVVE